MKVGFIGCGNMAKAMIHGMLGSKKVQPQEMIASAKSEKTREAISSQIGIRAAKTNTEVLEFADIVFSGGQTAVSGSGAYRDQRSGAPVPGVRFIGTGKNT